ncbi:MULTISPECIES: type IV secretory system conjugative DNA transfer family protein [Deinococcus]|uniref:Type IV secretory system conjugative DNA transfer family protein n=1 Tax=Deinococcus rufus TaxID=2136097 RepID=A0ABV7ZA63_9DEIO|nr:type IV secretory system conjugative DNA transfer family protein [Deinococcus sp. AB2017081]WQE97463.1 type IV secretory system conjugative DNA transfer family protein [Deinococcus sp. AB2017081]WQE97487.1 type IV secretory system conjugative DNA transfer family protein [Deinococcus sp. AB2017081]
MKRGLTTVLLILAVLLAGGWLYYEAALPAVKQVVRYEQSMVSRRWPAALGDRSLRGVMLFARCSLDRECGRMLNVALPILLKPHVQPWGLLPSLVALAGALYMAVSGRRGRLYTGTWATWSQIRAIAVRFPTRHRGTIMLAARSPRQRQFLSVRAGQRGRRERGHVLVVGPSRSGKSLLLLANLLSWRHSMIVLDVKPELHALSSGSRQHLGPVYVLSPEGIGDQYDPYPDLLTSPEHLLSVAQHMAGVRNEREKIFAERAAFGIAALLRAAQVQGVPTLLYIASVVQGQGLAEYVHALRSLSDVQVHAHLAGFLGYSPARYAPDGEQDRFLMSCWGTMLTRLQPYLTPGVLAMTSARSFDPADLRQATVTVYLQFREDSLSATRPVFDLLVQGLMRGAVRGYDQLSDQDPEPLLLAIDEGGAVPIPNLPDFIALAASREISIMLYVQSLSHLQRAYGEADTEIILDNMHHQVYYPPRGAKTLQMVSNLSGRMSVDEERVTEGRGGQTSVSRGERDRPLVTPDELRKFPADTVVVVSDDLPLIKATRVEYFQHPRMRGLLDPDLFPPLPIAPLVINEDLGEAAVITKASLPTSKAKDTAPVDWQKYEDIDD